MLPSSESPCSFDQHAPACHGPDWPTLVWFGYMLMTDAAMCALFALVRSPGPNLSLLQHGGPWLFLTWLIVGL